MNNDIISRLDAIAARLDSIEKLLAAAPATKNTGTLPTAPPTPPERPLSIAEYVIQKGPTDDNQRTLVLASYLETHKSEADFTAEELRQAFIDSRLKVPSNVSDKIGKLAKKAQVMPVSERDGKKTWCLTMTGQAVVKEGFGK